MADRSRAKSRRSKFLAWWYITIGAGFFLLAANAILLGDAAWRIALRFVIAGGFCVLGYLELKSGASR